MRLIFMCCINFCYNTYFIPEASLPIKDDADLGGAVPFLQHVQPPGVAERGLDLAQEEVGGHGVAADALDGDAQFGPAARFRPVNRFIGLSLFTSGSAPLAPCLLGFSASLLFVSFGDGVDERMVRRHERGSLVSVVEPLSSRDLAEHEQSTVLG